MTDYQTLIGWYKDDEVYKTVCGNLVIKSTLAERINRRISEINHEMKHCTDIYLKYVDKQHELRNFIKSNNLTKKQSSKIGLRIRDNKTILRGLRVYCTQLKHEKNQLQRSHPNNMKKKTEI